LIFLILFFCHQGLKECHIRHHAGEPDYASLADSIERRVHETVGDKHWTAAENIHRMHLQHSGAPGS